MTRLPSGCGRLSTLWPTGVEPCYWLNASPSPGDFNGRFALTPIWATLWPWKDSSAPNRRLWSWKPWRSIFRNRVRGLSTWTGPYGSGKSSLVVALSALLGKDAGARREAAAAIGEQTAAAVWKAMPPKREGWRVLPIVGRRDRPERLVEEEFEPGN